MGKFIIVFQLLQQVLPEDEGLPSLPYFVYLGRSAQQRPIALGETVCLQKDAIFPYMRILMLNICLKFFFSPIMRG